MISNEYEFIFIHTPKTGGTSVTTALHRDTDQECRVIYAKEHNKYLEEAGHAGSHKNLYTNYDDEITHIYPQTEIFDWWGHWIAAEHYMAKVTERFYTKTISFTNPKDSFMVPNCALATSMVFGRGGYNGNIKHLPFYFWTHLLVDPRLKRYNTFKENYRFVGTVRNPYNREFSVFLYSKNKMLQDKAKGLKKSQIIKMLQEEWQIYTSQWSTLGEEYSSVIETSYISTNTSDAARAHMQNRAENPEIEPSVNVYGSQTSFLCVPLMMDKNNISLNKVTDLIRLEHVEEDYTNFCEKVGINKKGKVPHLLSNRKIWKKYLPKNITEWYSDKNLEDIHRFRWSDFALLGYENERIK
jgi:hypothetical protein